MPFPINGAPRGVADAVERRQHVGHEPAALLEDAEHGLWVGVPVGLEVRQGAQVHDLLEHEADITKWGDVVSHAHRVNPASLTCGSIECASLADTEERREAESMTTAAIRSEGPTERYRLYAVHAG